MSKKLDRFDGMSTRMKPPVEIPLSSLREYDGVNCTLVRGDVRRTDEGRHVGGKIYFPEEADRPSLIYDGLPSHEQMMSESMPEHLEEGDKRQTLRGAQDQDGSSGRLEQGEFYDIQVGDRVVINLYNRLVIV